MENEVLNAAKEFQMGEITYFEFMEAMEENPYVVGAAYLTLMKSLLKNKDTDAITFYANNIAYVVENYA